MKFAGVAVTYNRKEELVKNIQAISSQTKRFDMYYIIDNNSNDGTKEELKRKKILDLDWIKFVQLPENIGGAGGFYEGTKIAFNEGCDFICLMDDDGRPANDQTFEVLYNKACDIYQINKMMMINSSVICDDKQTNLSFGLNNWTALEQLKENHSDGVIKNYINPFNGTIISKWLVEKIGFPNKDFFIRGDEVDYQSRAQKAGAFIGTIVDSIYYHPKTELIPAKWLGKTVYFGICPSWKQYYLIRNYTYRLKRDEGVVAAIKEIIFQFYGLFKCNKKWKECVPLFFAGAKDGLTGKLGRLVEPGAIRK